MQINPGIPLELGRLPSENGANLTTGGGGQQQKLSPPTPFADTKAGTNCCFSEREEEIGGDAAGMLFFPSNRIPEPLQLPNVTNHFSPATPINEPGETSENESGQDSEKRHCSSKLILICSLCFRIRDIKLGWERQGLFKRFVAIFRLPATNLGG